MKLLHSGPQDTDCVVLNILRSMERVDVLVTVVTILHNISIL